MLAGIPPDVIAVLGGRVAAATVVEAVIRENLEKLWVATVDFPARTDPSVDVTVYYSATCERDTECETVLPSQLTVQAPPAVLRGSLRMVLPFVDGLFLRQLDENIDAGKVLLVAFEDPQTFTLGATRGGQNVGCTVPVTLQVSHE